MESADVIIFCEGQKSLRESSDMLISLIRRIEMRD